MESDLIIQQFEQIEGRVETLIAARKAVEVENLELKTQVKTLEEALRKKEETEHDYQEEKVLIRSKIDGLLAKMEAVAVN